MKKKKKTEEKSYVLRDSVFLQHQVVENQQKEDNAIDMNVLFDTLMPWMRFFYLH